MQVDAQPTEGKDQMYQSLHNELAKATAPRRPTAGCEHLSERGRGSPPKRARVRRHAAGALASMARHLDAESARRVVA
jgi:hypothetical protein